MITKIILSEGFSVFASVFGLLGDLALLGLTIYTLHLTAFSRKLEWVSNWFNGSSFFGNRIDVILMNKTLHAIPIQSLFVLKKHGEHFYYICLGKYDDPLIIESWRVLRIASEPFTNIISWDGEELEPYDVTDDAVIGVEAGNKTIWVKPYRKAPLKEAKKAYREHRFSILTVNRYT